MINFPRIVVLRGVYSLANHACGTGDHVYFGLAKG
jgi:hypothetical protein